MIDGVQSDDPGALARFTGSGPDPVLVDALYRFLQADSGDQHDLAGDAEAELAGLGVPGAGERFVWPQQGLADEVFRGPGFPPALGGVRTMIAPATSAAVRRYSARSRSRYSLGPTRW